MIAAVMGLALLITPEAGFPDDTETLSSWMQHGCRIQQMNRQGGEEAAYGEFCGCFDAAVAERTSPAAYRLYALGTQGAIGEQSIAPDWEAARDEVQARFPELPADEQARAGLILQQALSACISLAPPTGG